MKKISFIYLTICLSFILKSAAQTKTIVSGKITNPKSKFIELTNWRNGELVTKIRINEKGYFKFSTTISGSIKYSFSHGNEQTTLYLFEGDSLYLTLNTNQFDETLTYFGKGKEANNYLAKQTLAFEKNIGSNDFDEKYNGHIVFDKEDEFCKFVDSVATIKLNFLNKFKEHLTVPFYDYSYADIIFKAANDKITYPQYHYLFAGIKDSIVKVAPSFYNFINDLNITNENYLNSFSFESYLLSFVEHKTIQKLNRDSTSFGDRITVSKEILTGKIKEKVLTSYLTGILEFEPVSEINKYYFKERNEITDKDLQNELDTKYAKMSKLFPGNLAPDFSVKTNLGKTVKLSDFKGKVVYIDFWATWCGPCMQEVPNAKILNKSFANKEVVFLYVSLDEDKNEWLKIIQKKELKGVHVNVKGFNDPIAKKYAISGIPTFFLIGKDGKIANNAAPRPSDPNVYLEIEKALAQ